MPFRRGLLRRLQAAQAFQQTAESLYLWPKGSSGCRPSRRSSRSRDATAL